MRKKHQPPIKRVKLMNESADGKWLNGNKNMAPSQCYPVIFCHYIAWLHHVYLQTVGEVENVASPTAKWHYMVVRKMYS